MPLKKVKTNSLLFNLFLSKTSGVYGKRHQTKPPDKVATFVWHISQTFNQKLPFVQL